MAKYKVIEREWMPREERWSPPIRVWGEYNSLNAANKGLLLCIQKISYGRNVAVIPIDRESKKEGESRG
mgnify:CR=1 FL=1